MTPLVSVVIPAYNSSRTILRALDSVAAQDYPNLETIVADDASTDGTPAIAARRGIKVVRLPENQGASAARNAAILEASGKYVAFLDSDDAWRPGKISKQVARAECDPRIGLVTCDSIVRNQAGEIIKHLHGQNPPSEGPDVWKALLGNNFIPTPTVLARKDLLRSLGGFDRRLRIAEDLDLWIRLAAISHVAVVREVLVEVHDQPGSLHKRHSDEEESSILTVVETNLARQRQRLTGAEVRRIRGQRYFKLGANYYAGRMYRASVPAFWRAAKMGFRPLKSVFNLQRAIWKQAWVR